jgi:hypothetical protein
MATREDTACPFCGEPGYDLIGLKHHLNSGWCGVFNNTRTVDSSRRTPSPATQEGPGK